MGREKGCIASKKKTGKMDCRIEGDHGAISIIAFKPYAETICLDFISAVNFKNLNGITFSNVMDHINLTFQFTANTLVASCLKYLNENIAPAELRKDIIIVAGPRDEEKGGPYQMNKLKKGKGIVFKFGIYIHTKNAITPNSVQIKFFNNFSQESDDVKNLREFCNSILNSPILSNNENIISTKFVRGKL